jgi:Na+/phosphate symporter
MMKKIFALGLVCAVLPASAAFAQMDSYLEMLRSDVRTEKVAVITEVMGFTDEEAEVFWPIYRKYELELAKLFDMRVKNIKNYAEHFEALDDDKADELLKTAYKIDEKRTKLHKSYYEKFKKAIGAKRAARFMQLDYQIDLLIDLQIAANLPLIE